jgi:hypothetical protein
MITLISMHLRALMLACLLCGGAAAGESPVEWKNDFYEPPLFLSPLYGHNFLADGFNPWTVKTTFHTSPRRLADQLKPRSKGIPYDPGQIVKGRDFAILNDCIATINKNADLGLQHTLRTHLRADILVTRDGNQEEHPAFVILSHGHAIAGLAELARMTTTNRHGAVTALFDTSVYMPLAGWSATMVHALAPGRQAQEWGDTIERARMEFALKRITLGTGVAIGLNGHRGVPDKQGNLRKGCTANIDPQRMLGSPRTFAETLRRRSLRRVVIVTEYFVKDPDKVNVLPLTILKTGMKDFATSNQDLLDYMVRLQHEGVEVIVVSGEQRTLPEGV